jgi:6-phosphogluconolactonase
MRRIFVMGAGLFLPLSAIAAPERFYLGTYTAHSTSQGIYAGALDPDTGKLSPLVLAEKATDPNFLVFSPDRRFLYAAQGSGRQNSIGAYAVQPDGTLKLIDQQPAGGSGTCFVSLDVTGRTLLAANYSSGSIACFPLGAGGFLRPLNALVEFHGSGPDPARQAGPHAHSVYVSPDNRFVYACDLGCDLVRIFRFDGLDQIIDLSPALSGLSASVPPGSGPRHLVFGQFGRVVYVVNEMGATVSVFTRDTTTGALTLVETVSCLPPGISPGPKITAAEIALHPSGRWLYVSVRGCDLMAVFAVDGTGRLTLIQNLAAGVKMPRQFALDPGGQWLVAAGQADNRLAVLKIDPATGLLSATGESASVGAPVCVLFDQARKN